ncbi:hypothetical protein [Oerskovia flava]|uniref:hypothetical protein n=1 Tax=Oerskovia flava TaxID=2986422 RepID=UPI0022400B76|nr:hypothetical protein [Oerskovia sp. JB1-3-2]
MSSGSPLAHASLESFESRAAYLYGLIITGSVLAAAPEDLGILRVVGLLAGTLAVYWCAETYASMMAARARAGRPLTGSERRAVLLEGLPLVAACAVPVTVLFAEAVLRLEPSTAVDIALLVNLGLLGIAGWRMSTRSGMTGWRRVASTAFAGLLGAAMIALKLSLHH